MAAKQVGLYAPQTPQPLLAGAVKMSEQRKPSEPEQGSIVELQDCELTTIFAIPPHPHVAELTKTM